MDMEPRDYGLPFESWREHQLEVVEEVLQMSDDETIILEAPTGFGKSAIPAAVASRHYVAVITGTKDLQAQYERFGFAVMKGKGNYPCVNQDFIAAWRRDYGYSVNGNGVEEPSREDCTIADDCPFKSECPYERAKARARASRKLVMNVHYANYTNFWRDRPFVFHDEAHNLPNVLAQINEFSVTARQFEKYALPRPNAKGSAGWALDNLRRWVAAAQALASAKCGQLEGRGRLACIRFRLKLERMERALEVMREGDVYVINNDTGLHIKTVNPTPFAKRIIVPDAKNVLMSATVGNYRLLAGELGINSDIRFISLPHPFPQEIRPVVFVSDMPSMGRKATFEDWKKLVETIKQILDYRPYQKGIIHVSSWQLAERLRKALAKEGYSYRCYVPDKNREEAVEHFKKADKPLVAISPSWREGIDLPDDAGRLSIIAKLPYPNLGDPIVKLRLRRSNGWQWYRWVTALGVVQAAGRVVRHASDYGETFILDGSWKRVSANAPLWFQPEEVESGALESWLVEHRKKPTDRELERMLNG